MAEEKRDALDALIGDIIGDGQAEAARQRQQEAAQQAMREMQERRKAVLSKEEERIREVGWRLVQKVAADLNAGGVKVEATAEPKKAGTNNHVHLGTIIFQKPENHKVPAVRLVTWVTTRTTPEDELQPTATCEALVSADVRSQRGEQSYQTVGRMEYTSEETIRELLRVALARATGKA